MNELAAQRSQIDKIVKEIQSIQETLVCSICLELFNEPVTIKCGHRFCRSCILRHTNNENSACPLCNNKIRRRSIPSGSNETFQLLVKQFNALIQAIKEDSGINVLELCNKTKNTIESVPLNQRPSTSRFEETLNISKPSTSKFEENSNISKGSSSATNQKSTKSKVKSQSSKRTSLTKKQVNSETKKSTGVKNTLHGYFSNKSDNVPSQEQLRSDEKVKSWLNNIVPHIDDAGNSDSPLLKKENEKFKVPEKLESTKFNEHIESPRSNNPGTSKAKESESDTDDSESTKEEEPKYKETQSRIQELEMIAKKKKTNLSLSDKPIVKSASTVPAAAHSDAFDWRRVKKIGKEMQAKTFKSLNVSVEKFSSPVTVDENVPSTSSASNDRSKQKLKIHDNSHQRENLNPKTNNSSINTTGSHKEENVSFSNIDEQQVNDIIGILPAQDDLCTPERTRNILKNSTKNHETDTDDNFQNSPLNHKLSLKKNLTNPSNSKLISSQPCTPDKINQCETNSPRKNSPERSKSRLSLRLPTAKVTDQIVKQLKPTVSNENEVKIAITNKNTHKQSRNSDRNSTTSHGSHISFKKLGKICKKRKNVPFFQRGKIGPKIISNTDGLSVLVKSIEPVNYEIKSLTANSKQIRGKPPKNVPDNQEMKILSPEEDSQLKHLTINSPHRQKGENKTIAITENINKSIIENSQQDQSHIPMEVDPVPQIDPEAHVSMEIDETFSIHHEKKHELELQKENNSGKNSKEVHVEIEDIKDCEEIDKHLDKETVEDNFQSDLTKASTSKTDSKINILTAKTVCKSMPSLDIESCKYENESDHSENNQNSNAVKVKANEDEVEEEESDIVSISSKETCKYAKSPIAQKIVTNEKIDLTEDEKNVHSEAESNTDSDIQQKSSKTSAVSASTVSSLKESNKYSASGSNADSNIGEVKVQPLSRKIRSNCASTLSSNRERNKVSEAESNADSDVPKIRRRSRKTRFSSSSSLTSEKERNKISKAESNADVDSKTRRKSKKENSSSDSSCSIKKLPKKKRVHSDSSNDDEDLDISSIVGKWCQNTEVPVCKKAKINVDSNSNSNRDKPPQELPILIDDDDVMDVTLVGDENQEEPNALQRDPPIDDIITKVKSFKETEPTDNKVVGIPSSLQSTDLFESNEPCIQYNAQISSKPGNSKETGDKNQNASDNTLVDSLQTSRKKSNMSVSSDGSNKENSQSNKMNPSSVRIEEMSENQINEIGISFNEKPQIIKNLNTSPTDAYPISESLMNITEEQLALKRIEKDLIGVDLSTIHDNRNKIPVEESDKFSTPHGRKKQTRNIDEVNEDNDFDPDNIDATPCAKKSRKSILDAVPNQLLSKFNAGSPVNSSEMFSPGSSTNLIPAITPVKNRKSYPLCHSTPVVNAPNSEKQPIQQMVLVCSGLQANQIKIMHKFAKQFDAKFQNAFTMDVTHVITSTEAGTKVGQRTFKYIQGVAFQKHVVSFQWILDCLDKNVLLDEEDEKYEVLDGDVLESGAKRSRNRQGGLFESFAFLCLEPFTTLSITEFKSILVFNGASVVDSVEELAAQKDKYRVTILQEGCDLSQRKINALKKAKCALISFDWIVDSISQYHAISIAPYLQEMSPEELLALGFPAEYAVEEEFEDEEEEEGD